MTLTYERLHEVLDYTPFDGLFRWKISNSNRIKIGELAGWNVHNRYVQINIDGISYQGHILAWFYIHGYLPENDIDHLYRIKNDNRIRRLRETSRQCNMRNTNNLSNNTSGIKGVSYHKQQRLWYAYIENNKRYSLGAYKEFDDAVCARLAGEQCLDWSNCDSTSPAYLYVQKLLLTGT